MNTQNSLDDRQREAEIARRDRLRIALDAWWERLTQRTSEWNLETVKHLVVLNAAGIAGVARYSRARDISSDQLGSGPPYFSDTDSELFLRF